MVAQVGIGPTRSFEPVVLSDCCLPVPSLSDLQNGRPLGICTPTPSLARASKARMSAVPSMAYINLVEELGFEPRFSAFRKQRERPDFPIPRNGRVGEIRTHDFLVPNQAR